MKVQNFNLSAYQNRAFVWREANICNRIWIENMQYCGLYSSKDKEPIDWPMKDLTKPIIES